MLGEHAECHGQSQRANGQHARQRQGLPPIRQRMRHMHAPDQQHGDTAKAHQVSFEGTTGLTWLQGEEQEQRGTERQEADAIIRLVERTGIGHYRICQQHQHHAYRPTTSHVGAPFHQIAVRHMHHDIGQHLQAADRHGQHETGQQPHMQRMDQCDGAYQHQGHRRRKRSNDCPSDGRIGDKDHHQRLLLHGRRHQGCRQCDDRDETEQCGTGESHTIQAPLHYRPRAVMTAPPDGFRGWCGCRTTIMPGHSVAIPDHADASSVRPV